MINKIAINSYKNHKCGAKFRGIGFDLTLEQWYEWWLIQGVDKNIKTSSLKGDILCMCRKEDKGAYRIGNIYCATKSQNTKDAAKFNPRIGWKLSDETKKKIGAAQKGRKHTPETLKRMSAARVARGAIKMTPEVSERRKKKIGKAFEGLEFYNNGKKMIRLHDGDEVPDGYIKGYLQVTCPHCGKEGHQSIMKRWHFDNCSIGKQL